MDTKVLFKNRSITSCMKAAYDYIGSHFTSLIKKTWWATLIYSALLVLHAWLAVLVNDVYTLNKYLVVLSINR